MNLSSITQVTTDKIANLAITDAKIANETISQSKIVSGYGFVPTGTIIAYAKNATPPGGWLQCNGAAVLISSYPDLAAAIYCGDALNATAEFGYKATSSAGTTRSTTGTYITIPDLRGIFIRGAGSQTITDLRSVSRTYTGTFAQIKSDSVQRIQGSAELGTASWGCPVTNGDGVFEDSKGAFDNSGVTQPAFGSGKYLNSLVFDSSDSVSSGTETAPANIALLYCIKF